MDTSISTATDKRMMIIEVICFLYVILFLYAAFSKVLDYADFRLQISRSPLAKGFSSWQEWSEYIAVLIPVLEIVLAIALTIPRYRFKAMIASLALMMMFTIYIVLILTVAPFIPCLCGGIIQKMSWSQHLVFNVFFIGLALAALVLSRKY